MNKLDILYRAIILLFLLYIAIYIWDIMEETKDWLTRVADQLEIDLAD